MIHEPQTSKQEQEKAISELLKIVGLTWRHELVQTYGPPWVSDDKYWNFYAKIPGDTKEKRIRIKVEDIDLANDMNKKRGIACQK